MIDCAQQRWQTSVNAKYPIVNQLIQYVWQIHIIKHNLFILKVKNRWEENILPQQDWGSQTLRHNISMDSHYHIFVHTLRKTHILVWFVDFHDCHEVELYNLDNVLCNIKEAGKFLRYCDLDPRNLPGQPNKKLIKPYRD